MGVVAIHHLGKVRDLFFSAKETAKHCSHLVGCERNIRCPGPLSEALEQLGGSCLQSCIEIGFGNLIQHGKSGSYGQRTARQCAGLIYSADRGDHVHDFRAAAKRADWQPATDYLA